MDAPGPADSSKTTPSSSGDGLRRTTVQRVSCGTSVASWRLSRKLTPEMPKTRQLSVRPAASALMSVSRIGFEYPRCAMRIIARPTFSVVVNMKLWPKALPRPMRFHDLRGTTATTVGPGDRGGVRPAPAAVELLLPGLREGVRQV